MKSKYFKNSANVQSGLKTLKNTSERLSIDEIDKKILRYLVQDARLSYRGISRLTKLSATTVIQRLRKLKMNGVIEGYSAILNPKKLGYELAVIIELVAPKLILIKAMEEITKLPNIYAIYHTTGNIDAIIIAKFKGVDELQDFLGQLYSKFEIQRSETRIVLKTMKEDFRVLV